MNNVRLPVALIISAPDHEWNQYMCPNPNPSIMKLMHTCAVHVHVSSPTTLPRAARDVKESEPFGYTATTSFPQQ